MALLFCQYCIGEILLVTLHCCIACHVSGQWVSQCITCDCSFVSCMIAGSILASSYWLLLEWKEAARTSSIRLESKNTMMSSCCLFPTTRTWLLICSLILFEMLFVLLTDKLCDQWRAMKDSTAAASALDNYGSWTPSPRLIFSIRGRL